MQVKRTHASARMCSWYRGCIECRLERIEPLEIPEDAAAGVRKPASFKLALANTWRLLKVNIYHFVLLNFNKVIRPGESLQYFYWHIKMSLNPLGSKPAPVRSVSYFVYDREKNKKYSMNFDNTDKNKVSFETAKRLLLFVYSHNNKNNVLLKNKENKQGAFSAGSVSVTSLHRHVNKTTWISANTCLKYMRNICIESLKCLLLNEVSQVQNKYSLLK